TSVGLAKKLGAWRDDGVKDVVFMIGGAGGLHGAVKKRAQLALSFGAVTWPHLLTRGLLAEQIYRAESILSGHPYHRK
ncbi:MAG: 23S rRNA (pseudouridine(1915)-N(3))-methyltransferase RlmH, partial [Pseudomonadota bacterium]|nr:23S rRNA (pseudouridine(1915)-N(3))-methyltransferase RlmH [Pseudomonadota bacterium]